MADRTGLPGWGRPLPSVPRVRQGVNTVQAQGYTAEEGDGGISGDSTRVCHCAWNISSSDTKNQMEELESGKPGGRDDGESDQRAAEQRAGRPHGRAGPCSVSSLCPAPWMAFPGD